MFAFADGSRWLVIAAVGIGASYVLRFAAGRVRSRAAARLRSARVASGLAPKPRVEAPEPRG